MVSSSNEVDLSFWSGSSEGRIGRGFKVLISAVNPVCYPMHYDHHYGDYGCQSSCGGWLGPVVPSTLPPPTTTTTPPPTTYVCEGDDCTEPPSTPPTTTV